MSAQKSPAISTETPAEPSRRKRKSTSALSSSNPPPTKRLIKERNALNISDSSSIFSGPYTRASRHSPVKFATSAAEVLTAPHATLAIMVDDEVEEVEPLDFEEVVDAEFDAVSLRGKDVHVVPIHCGWFSWKEIHSIEKHTLASFFNGKSENRTPEIYLKIRNSIMSRFHTNPQTQLELKDLDDISVSDSEAKQEVMEFLDHWGLINFHPFIPENPDVSNSNAGGADKSTASLLDKLFQFETAQPCPRFVRKKVEMSVPTATPRILPESSITDELVGPVGPSVEYHCNSCSADCSRKRYHCQKQADFDLCTDCYKNEKFDSNMAPSDFILMEPAEIPGASSGRWTDQETLLLLEALELFSENWNEIAEHVATKTKSQCILHFLQMPIEDSFLEEDNDTDENKETSASENKETNPGDNNETNICDDKEAIAGDEKETNADNNKEANTGENKEANGGEQEEANAAGIKEANTDYSKEANATDNKEAKEIKNNDTEDKDLSTTSENEESIAVDALKAAFEAIGYVPEQEGLPSIAEAGNPVMTLAAFLTRLIEPDAALTSFRSSLKAISEEYPNIQLASRHCFILEDPPNDKKWLPTSESYSPTTEKIYGDTLEEDYQLLASNNIKENADSGRSEKSPMENDKDPSMGNEKTSVEIDNHVSLPHEKKLSMEDESCVAVDNEKNLPTVNEKTESDLSTKPNDSGASPTNAANETNDLKSKSDDQPDAIKDSSTLVSVDVAEPILDPSTTERKETPSDDQESKEKVNSSTTENVETVDGDDKKVSRSNNVKDDNLTGTKHNQNNYSINKLKRAAATVLSAAAVKAKLLANQEENQIRQLVSLIIEKQLRKIELKLSLFSDIESVILRMKEQTERARHKLMHERQQIIAARLGMAASARANLISQNTNKSMLGLNPPVNAPQNPSLTRRP